MVYDKKNKKCACKNEGFSFLIEEGAKKESSSSSLGRNTNISSYYK
jgi:hypothetical protein